MKWTVSSWRVLHVALHSVCWVSHAVCTMSVTGSDSDRDCIVLPDSHSAHFAAFSSLSLSSLQNTCCITPTGGRSFLFFVLSRWRFRRHTNKGISYWLSEKINYIFMFWMYNYVFLLYTGRESVFPHSVTFISFIASLFLPPLLCPPKKFSKLTLNRSVNAV